MGMNTRLEGSICAIGTISQLRIRLYFSHFSRYSNPWNSTRWLEFINRLPHPTSTPHVCVWIRVCLKLDENPIANNRSFFTFCSFEILSPTDIRIIDIHPPRQLFLFVLSKKFFPRYSVHFNFTLFKINLNRLQTRRNFLFNLKIQMLGISTYSTFICERENTTFQVMEKSWRGGAIKRIFYSRVEQFLSAISFLPRSLQQENTWHRL